MSELKDMYKTVQKEIFPDTMSITLGDSTLKYTKRTWTINNEEKGLRYGENPDQPAALYELVEGELNCGGISWRGANKGLVSAISEEHMLQSGKHPGKTNLTDLDNGINILQYLSKYPAAIILKHNNPCGAAWSKTNIADALEKAFWCDRIAAFGGAIVVNRPLDKVAATLIANNYFEIVAAPEYEEGVFEILSARKSLRIIKLSGLANLEELSSSSFLDFKCLTDGGIIIQKSFSNNILQSEGFIPASATTKDGLCLTTRAPNKQELEDLLFAWAIEAGVSSNSVIFAKNGATLAIGTGEQDRVGCVELAIYKAYTKFADAIAFKKTKKSLYELKQEAESNPDMAEFIKEIEEQTAKAKGGLAKSVLVSDGFFPFRDSIDILGAEGVSAIAQPGGSLRDSEIIMACNEICPQIAMVFTGQRSFKH